MRATMAKGLSLRWLSAIVLLCVVVVGRVHAEGLIYSIKRDGGPTSYLVGTMHSEDPRVLALLDDFGPLIDQVDGVAIEMVPDAVTMLAVGAATLLPFDQSLRDMLGDRRFTEVKRAARTVGIPPEMVDRLKPWAVAITLGMPAAKSGRILDTEIYLYALNRQRETIGLESAEEQLSVFEHLTLDAQLQLLDEMVNNLADLPIQFEQLTLAYLAGDLDGLERFAQAQNADLPVAVREWLDDKLVTERNRRMLSRLAGLLPAKSLFIAVGALHLVGDEGLVEGLRRQGFTVEPWSA